MDFLIIQERVDWTDGNGIWMNRHCSTDISEYSKKQMESLLASLEAFKDVKIKQKNEENDGEDYITEIHYRMIRVKCIHEVVYP